MRTPTGLIAAIALSVLTPSLNAQTQTTSPGTVFRDCSDCPEMVVVPAGVFTMGSPEREEGRFEDEGPVHRVTISRAFAVGRYEVKVGEFRAFANETDYAVHEGCWQWNPAEQQGMQNESTSWRNPGYSQTDGYPVTCVNVDDAQAYAAWLSTRTGEGYRLLNEAEWEYAARAGTSSPWHNGNNENEICGIGNVADQAARQANFPWPPANCDDGYYETAPAGTYQPNAFGLYDTAGNLFEWTLDCWNESYEGAPTDGSTWVNGDCDRRVMRGGSWFNSVPDARSALRGFNNIGFRGNLYGFRLARTLSP